VERIEFEVQGSSPEPYRVIFELEGTTLNAFCDCPAGKKRQYCKHRFGIMRGEEKGVVSNNIQQVAIIPSWLPGTDVESALSQLAKAEHEFSEAKKRVSGAKRDLARAMHS